MRRSMLPAVLVTAVVGLLLMVPLPGSRRSVVAGLNLLHAPVFALLGVVIIRSFAAGRWASMTLRRLAAWLAVVAFGVLAEYLQPLVGRHASLYDLIANVAGATAGLLWAAVDRHKSATVRIIARGAGIALLAWALGPPAAVLFDVYRQMREKPVLASFENGLELSRWSGQDVRASRSRQHPAHGNWSLRLDLLPGRYPGVTLRWPPADWSAYTELVFDTVLQGKGELPLIVKIEDAAHNDQPEDRFHQRVVLQPGRQRVRVRLDDVVSAPKGRRMNLRQIAKLQFFTVRLENPRTVYLDNIRLR